MSSGVFVTCRTGISASALLLALVCSTLCVAQTQSQKSAAKQTAGAAPVPSAKQPKPGAKDKPGKDGASTTAPAASAVPGTAPAAPAAATPLQAGGAVSGSTTPGANAAQGTPIDQATKDAAQAAKDKQDEAAANLEKDENLLKLLTPEQRKLLDAGQKIPSPTGVFAEYPWLVPAVAVLLSLLAGIYVTEIRRRAARQIERSWSSMNDLRNQLSAAEQELLARSTPVASPAAESIAGRGAGKASTSRGVMRAVDAADAPEPGEAVAAVGSSNNPSERESKGIPSATAARPVAAPVAPNPRKPTGDIVADYNKARSMGDDGAEWFKENYTWFSLSCTNFNERVLHPSAVLLFQEESRGSFLAVTHRGETRLVPAFHNELEVSSSFLAGIFDYPPQTNGPLVLFRAATVEKSGSLWQLRQSGEIKLER